MIESDLATYLEPIISPAEVIVGKILPTTTESVSIFSVGEIPNNYYSVKLDNIQISVRTEDLSRTREIADLILKNIIGYYGVLGDHQIVLWINSITGDIYEDDGRTIQKTILCGIKYS